VPNEKPSIALQFSPIRDVENTNEKVALRKLELEHQRKLEKMNLEHKQALAIQKRQEQAQAAQELHPNVDQLNPKSVDQLNVQSVGQFEVGLVGQFNAFFPLYNSPLFV
jgi:hypothetical protein